MLDETVAAPLVRMVLENVMREYPNHVMHMFNSDADALPPRQLHPAFYGSYDWHSAVHSHWMLVRVLRLLPQAKFAAEVVATLDNHLSAANIAQECAYFEAPHRVTFERPYGLAWVLQLAAELAEWDVPDARRWRTALRPMERLAARRIAEWLPKLGYPIRGGEHANSAFSLALAYDWSRTVQDSSMRECIAGHSRRFYAADRNAALAYEPSGQDFLSASLAEADLMRRVFAQREFSEWLNVFMPQLPANGATDWLPIVTPRDPADPKLSHLDGLNLSRAWMLEGIAGSLPAEDARRVALLNTARLHADAGVAAIRSELYEGSHWLPSFAVYLLTERGRQPG